MRRIALAVLFGTMFAAQAARASDVIVPADKAKDAIAADTAKDAVAPDTAMDPIAKETSATDTPKDPATPDTTLKLVAAAPRSIAGRTVLSSLYVGLAAFQAYDVYSTTKAISGGAAEANPMMRSLVGNRAAFIGVKAAITGGSIFAAERLWREHHRSTAVALMMVSNGMMAMVAAHNASVIARQR